MKDGEHIEYFDSGDIWFKCNYLDGNRHGECISYYKSGEISYKINYIDGNRNGESIYYFISGEIYSKYYHIDGEFVSELGWICYNRNLKFELLGL